MKYPQIQVLRLKYHIKRTVTPIDKTSASGKPQEAVSMPFTRFMPNRLAMSVGNIRIMLMLVSIFMTEFMLLLIRLA